MALRFRRSIRILPGLRLNLGKRGVSASVGVRGAHITVGKSGVRETVGIPGSGVSYTHLTPTAEPAPTRAQQPSPSAARIAFALFLLAVAVGAVIHALSKT
jgi:Protein of unknown function (DUF4236)